MSEWAGYYTIGADHVPLPCFELLEWAKWHANNHAARRVADDATRHYRVSTVFLALDHSFGGGDPVLFETMVFFPDGAYGDMERYCTWDEAVAGHQRFLAQVERQLHNALALGLARWHCAPARPASRNAREGHYRCKRDGRHVRGDRA